MDDFVALLACFFPPTAFFYILKVPSVININFFETTSLPATLRAEATFSRYELACEKYPATFRTPAHTAKMKGYENLSNNCQRQNTQIFYQIF